MTTSWVLKRIKALKVVWVGNCRTLTAIKYLRICIFKKLSTHLFSILHLLSRTLQCVLKSSKSFRHLRSCWQTDSAWLHVGRASIGYGSFSAAKGNGRIIISQVKQSIKKFYKFASRLKISKTFLQLQYCNLPFLSTNPHGWSNRKSRKWLQSGSMPGSLQRQVGRKNWNACSVLNAAWHFVTVTVLQDTARTMKFRRVWECEWERQIVAAIFNDL